MKAWRWVALFVLVLTAKVAHSDPVQSEVAITLPQGATSFRSFLRVTEFSRGGDTVEVHNQVAHGLTAKTNLLLLVPVLKRQDGSSGLGDVTLLLKERIWKKNGLQLQERFSVIGGVKLPTRGHGESTPVFEHGSGSFDFPVGILFAHDSARGFFADALYTFRTGKDGYRFGNTLRYDLAYTHALAGGDERENFVWLALELNGTHSARDKREGETVGDTGGHVLYFSPGLRLVHWSGRYVLDLSYQVPLETGLYGNQPTPRRAWLLGARTNF